MGAPDNLIAFRDLLRARFPEAHAVPPPRDALETGVPCLDAADLAAGSICEIVSGGASAGSGLLLAALAEGTHEAVRWPAALVDGADAFDPASLPDETLRRLLWLRCRSAELAMRAADLLLRDGNLPRVLLDLQLCAAHDLRRIPAQAWHRLRLLAEKSGATLCVFTPFQTVPCARSRILLDQPLLPAALETPRAELISALQGHVTRRSAVVNAEKQLVAG